VRVANRWAKILGVFVALVLTGCETVHSIKSDFESSKAFDRKVRCESYSSKTEQEFKAAARELSGKNDISYSTERVFYSSKRNSCVCILRASSVVKGKSFDSIQTLDVLTKEDLGFKTYSGDEIRNLNKDVQDQVKSLE
jgi:hypothetical protein